MKGSISFRAGNSLHNGIDLLSCKILSTYTLSSSIIASTSITISIVIDYYFSDDTTCLLSCAYKIPNGARLGTLALILFITYFKSILCEMCVEWIIQKRFNNINELNSDSINNPNSNSTSLPSPLSSSSTTLFLRKWIQLLLNPPDQNFTVKEIKDMEDELRGYNKKEYESKALYWRGEYLCCFLLTVLFTWINSTFVFIALNLKGV